MKIINFLFLGLFLLNGSVIAQKSYLSKKYADEGSKILQALKQNEKDSLFFQKNLQHAISNYCIYYNYSSITAEGLFSVISELAPHFKDEYYRFLLVNTECFTEIDIQNIKQNLKSILNESDVQFYDIVSIYQLSAYKDYLIKQLNPDFLIDIRTAFKSNSISQSLIQDAKPYTTLANLGDRLIEDTLVSLVNEFYDQYENSIDSIEKPLQYKEIFFKIIPSILGKINSKRSVYKTVRILENKYYLDFEHSEDYGNTSSSVAYINNVLLPKVSRVDQVLLTEGMLLKGKNTFLDNGYLNKIKKMIKNNEFKWKKFIIDVN